MVARFGRFPYRNGTLGKANTPDEVKFIKNPPPWGKTKAEIDSIQDQKKQAQLNKGQGCIKPIEQGPAQLAPRVPRNFTPLRSSKSN